MDPTGDHWLRRNAPTLFVLLVIFGLAWFLRAWFVWDLAAPQGLLSGGSDSFYYENIIRHAVTTGRQIDMDCLLNYPICVMNPRPPMFAWFSASVGSLLSPLATDVWSSVSAVFLMSTAFWGALTVIPTYLLAKDAFGKRAGIIAAFLLAVLPAHLQRSPATNADHDSFVLFFVVTAFYFFLKSLEGLNEKRWVSSWRDRKSITAGLRLFFQENREPVLYATLSGWATATVALTWQGWAYAPIILLAYFLIQIFVHRLRNQDTLGITVCFGIALGLPLLISAPWYFPYGYVGTWYDVPAYLFLAAMAFGIIFTVTRDLPWALVTPTIVGVATVGLAVAAAVNPAVANAFISGAGYFVQNKAYETIAEAQAPGLSQAILSFGMASYYLSLAGLGLMALQYITGKNTKPYYLFVLVWSFAAVFMSMAAARFIFNAAPAFAVTAAWVIAKIVDLLDFDGMKRRFLSTHGSRLGAARRSVKVGHVAVALLLVVLVIHPNVFYATDAAIPYESKPQYDAQLCYALPEALRPSGCVSAATSGSTFFFGAFGYTLPLPRNYYPAAWDWLAQQDNDVPPELRPAYLSWWDYGFEAVDKGRHPTVADNFLDGYHLAGNFIAAQGEAEGIAYLSARLIEGDWRAHGKALSPGVKQILVAQDVDTRLIERVFQNAPAYYAQILADPARYGKRDQNLQPQNTWYIILKTELLEKLPGADAQADLYRAIRLQTGKSIRYFAADTRLFPTDGENTGIFYAPIKLSDHRVTVLSDGRTIPIDFFDIKAVVNGVDKDLEDVTATDQVSDLKIAYKPMFYNSMFYRAYVGFSPRQGGAATDDGIPGFSGPLQQVTALPGWNLAHWRLVYLTAYYNPYPAAEVSAHREASTAMNYFDAVEIQREIDAKRANGTVYLSPANAVNSGVVFLKYYDGAYVNGTVTVDGRVPVPNVNVTLSDELDVPHYVARTDAQGRYSALAPFGEVRVSATVGPLDGRTLRGSTILNTTTIPVSDAASMREEVDEDGNGVPDYLITLDLSATGVSADGVAFLDTNSNGRKDAGEIVAPGASVELEHNETRGFFTTSTANDEGNLRVEDVLSGKYLANVTYAGRRLATRNVDITGADFELAVPATEAIGRAIDEFGGRVAGAIVTLEDSITGTLVTLTTAANGGWNATNLLPGPHNVTVTLGDTASLRRFVDVTAESTVVLNQTVYRSATVSGRTLQGGAPLGFATLEFQRVDDSAVAVTARSDGNGAYSVRLPWGQYRVSSRHFLGSTLLAYGGELTLRSAGAGLDVRLVPGVQVEGLVFSGVRQSTYAHVPVRFEGANGIVTALTNNGGAYTAYVPQGTHAVSVSAFGKVLLRSAAVAAGDGTPSMTLDLDLRDGTPVRGLVWTDRDGDGAAGAGEGVSNATVAFLSSAGNVLGSTGPDGNFSVALPPGTYTPRFSKFGFDTFTGLAASPATLDFKKRWELTPSAARVSGAVTFGTDPAGAGLPVEFLARGPGARNATAVTGTDGRYEASVLPGDYEVRIDQAEDPFRLQLAGPRALNLSLADEARALDLAAVRRVQVSGAVTLDGVGKPAALELRGPDAVDVTADASGNFTALVATGAYNVSASFTEDGIRYGGLASFDVTGPGSLALMLQRASQVRGKLLLDGAPVTGELDITFTNVAGGGLTVTSQPFGDYVTSLLPGTYEVTVDAPSTATIDGTLRYVRYTHRSLVDVPSAPLQYDIDLERALDSSTVSGRVALQGSGVPALVSFITAEPGVLNASTVADFTGTYTVDVLPGNYTVYVTHTAGAAAFLGTYVVSPRTDAVLDFTLVRAARVSGSLLATPPGGAVRAVAGSIVFTAGGEIALATAGTYQVLLPPGTYGVTGEASLTERGIAVAYRSNVAATITGDRVYDVALDRATKGTVSVSWDTAQKRLIGQGGGVEYAITVTNTGNVDDTYSLSASVSGWTITFDPSSLSVDFGKTGNAATARVTIRAPRDATVDHPALVITARSTVDTTVRGTVTVVVDIVRVRAVALEVPGVTPTYDGTFLNYTLRVKNAGNAAETFTLTVPNAADLQQLNWLPRLLRSPTATPEVVLTNLSIAANATSDVVLRLQRLALLPTPGTAVITATEDADTAVAATVTVSLSLPQLAPQGDYPVQATGVGITREAPVDWALASVLGALLAVVGLAAFVFYRGRFRR